MPSLSANLPLPPANLPLPPANLPLPPANLPSLPASHFRPPPATAASATAHPPLPHMTTMPHYRSAGSQTPPTRFELPPGVIASEDIAHTATAAHAPSNQRGQKPRGSAGVRPPRHTTADHPLFAQRSAPETALDTPSGTNWKGFFLLRCRPTWGSLRRLPGSPRTYLLKVQWCQTLGWLSRCGQEEQTGKTGRWQQLLLHFRPT
jgi:hypothetical protein